ncbi:UDP-N-acetylmuramate dehydrogenase [Cryobacterium mesophilum]|uniref:UDP-N-acetylenolpyruvoylglucosamine reductase n=1 Tax=Terrimesophilobacter mesophilus TaxID=433647 RepID=A0A4R8VCH1_9MICO|nr:UDP-N-acetylmuramate dehydrogenase [Terrimesophilobacter mesophilus]MBB5633427.1 UDP-N-acetylmuramate dehydrogenase [Terrimesophilobacter mesophilus]TFB80146.1 UDP-N-acetylmuramate dehydrogenase [Terrimesophilobacter mesophilus]
MKFAELTTLRVGGEAREVLSPATADELVVAAREAWESGEQWLALGGGSNLLVADDGFDGTVIRVLTRGIEEVTGSRATLRVAAGEPWDAVVAFAVEHGLSGIEALSGIPGSAGAAPVQNIGAYGQELSHVLEAIDFLDAGTGERMRLAASDLDLGYRSSALKDSPERRGRRGIVLSLDLRLEVSELSAPIAYDQLATALGAAGGDRVPLAAVRAAVLTLRASKGMLLDPADPDSVSAGSFFTNPIVSENFARGLPDAAPRWILDPDAPESPVKLSAAWLIERAGITRGFSLPGSGAAVSSKHTLALVNRGGATANAIAELARYIHLRVLSEFGIRLQAEPQLVGVSL